MLLVMSAQRASVIQKATPSEVTGQVCKVYFKGSKYLGEVVSEKMSWVGRRGNPGWGQRPKGLISFSSATRK